MCESPNPSGSGVLPPGRHGQKRGPERDGAEDSTPQKKQKLFDECMDMEEQTPIEISMKLNQLRKLCYLETNERKQQVLDGVIGVLVQKQKQQHNHELKLKRMEMKMHQNMFEYEEFMLTKCTFNPSSSIFLDTKDMKFAGLSHAKLYMRTDNTNLWRELNDFKGMLAVQGPPGTGKSSLVWGWTYYQALHNSQKFLWLRYARTGDVYFVELQNQIGKKIKTFDGMVLSVEHDKLKELLRTVKNCTVIVDGLTKANMQSKLGQVKAWWRENEDERRAVFVSSCSVKLSVEDEELASLKTHWVHSWTYMQYQKACSYPNFFSTLKEILFQAESSMYKCLQEVLKSITDANQSLEDIKDAIASDLQEEFEKLMNEVIDERFYYAGGCARWFFGYKFEKTLQDINTQFNSVYSRLDYVKNLPGNRSERTVNHMLACFEDDVYVLISRYIAQSFFSKCGLDALKHLLEQDIVKKNPSFTGWIVELYFLMLLRAINESGAGGNLEVIRKDKTRETWKVQGYTDFEPTELDTLPETDWLVPMKWNQGGYDFIQLDHEEKFLRVVQVTHGREHPYKLEYVYNLCSKLRDLITLQFLDIVILYPSDEQCPKLSSVSGDLQLTVYFDYHTKDMWTKDHIRFLSFNTKK